MKKFSAFIVVAIALAAQLPYLSAVSYSGALSKLLGTTADLQEEKKTNADLQQISPTSGIVTSGCAQDFVQLNPNLEDLLTYRRHFDIEVTCLAILNICTDLKVHIDGKTYHSIICNHRGIRLNYNCILHYRSIIRPYI